MFTQVHWYFGNDNHSCQKTFCLVMPVNWYRRQLLLIELPSFTTMRFVLAGCGVCISSFSVPKYGSMSDLDRFVLMQWQQLWGFCTDTREYCTWPSKVDRQLRRKTNRVPEHHSASESKYSQVRAFENGSFIIISPANMQKPLWPASANLKMQNL